MTNQMVLNQESITQQRIIDLISWCLHVPSSQIYPYTHLRDDLCLDNIDHLLLIVALEQQLDVYLSNEEVESIETVDDARIYFQKYAA
ncbi:MAG: hypothetical protein DHS20C18_35120 [Saprospiraceae bacterium]|nr:MAG: hypothetical protein DHS20C18_35120 [Saprospiraceae bacterium]